MNPVKAAMIPMSPANEYVINKVNPMVSTANTYDV